MSSDPLPVMPGHPLEAITSTDVKNAFGKALTRVMRGAVVGITRHDEVSAVLLSADTYRTLLGSFLVSSLDPLAELRDRFDRRFKDMQTPPAQAAVRSLFEAPPGELGDAAVLDAMKRG